MNLYIAISVSIITYTYFLYPSLLFLIGKLINRKQLRKQKGFFPSITFIVAAHNSEKSIEKKILNSFECRYAANNIKYVFVSDGCTDKTDEIIEKHPAVHLIKLKKRVGKEQALQHAISYAKSDLLCFSDVDTMLKPDTLERLSENFSDPSVGAVSSYDMPPDNQAVLENLHIWYEMLLRKLESKISSCVGVSGSLFLARADICRQLTADCASDLAVSFICEKNNYRSVIESSAQVSYNKTADIRGERIRKTRTIVHGIRTIARHREILHLNKFGFFAWQVFSHKVLRWLSPITFISSLLLSLVSGFDSLVLYLSDSSSYQLLFTSASTLILASIVFYKTLSKSALLFFTYHIALFSALIDILRKKNHSTWEPTKRS